VLAETSPNANNKITVTQGGTPYADVQIDGQFITLSSGATFTIQGAALGHYVPDDALGNIADLTAAATPSPNYDPNMVISATGTDTLLFNDVNHNFGLIESSGTGNTLNITIAVGGNQQAPHALYNYGEILAANGGVVTAVVETPTGGDTTNLGNAGYIVVSGGTFITNTAITDGANVANGAGTPDGYIEIGDGGTAALLGSVASSQQVVFTDTLHNFLTIANNNSFSGSVAGFGAGDTIQIAGVTGATTLGYSGSLLTVGELNSGGTVTTTVTIDVGTGYSLASFGSVLSTGGLDIQAPSIDAAGILTFTGTAGTISSFEDRTKWAHNDAAGTLIPAGETVIIAAGTASISSSITETNSGTIIVSNSALIDTTSLVGNGFITIENGGQVTLANTTGTDSGQDVVFGGGGTSLALNTLDLTGSTLGFGGTITGFGLNDDIVLAGSVLPTVALGSQVSLAYTGSLLTVSELNSAGSATASTTLDVGTGYSLGSFVALLGTNGVNIETPATVIESPLTFSGTAGTINSFEDPTKYVGHLAPGSSIVSGETVLVISGTASIASTLSVINSGTINVTGTSTAFIDSATLSGGGTVAIGTGGHVTLANASGTDTGQTILFGAGGSATALNGLDINDNSGGFGGTIAGFGAYDAITLGTSVLPAATAGESYTESYNTATGVLTTKELSAAGSVVGTATLTITNTGSLTSGSFVDVIGANGVTIELGSTPLSNSGSLFIDYSEQATLANTSAVDTIPVTFGTHGSIAGLNILDINGTVTGTNSPYTGTISGFGLNDDIILGPSVLPSVATGSEVTLSYTGSLLTVGELNSGGSLTASTTIDVGTGYSTSSFVALLGTNGVNILTPATAAEEHLTFVGTAGTVSSFEDPTKYVGFLAPGSSIVTGETVIVASGTASIASTSPVTNSGSIIVSGSSLIDSASIAGTGFITIASGGQVTLANATGTDAGQSVLFSTGGTSLALNTLDLTGSTLGFGGTISGFGLNDDIVLGGSVLPTVALGSQVSLAYTGSLLTVAELNSAGSATASTTLDVGTGYSLGSFVALLGTNGVNIETPATVIESPLTFVGTAGTVSSFEDPTKYSGGLAPGSSIVTGETVIISAGTASIASTSPVINSGSIDIAGTSSVLIDSAALTGTGTLSITTGGEVTLANTTGVDTNLIYFGTGGTSAHPNLLDLTGTGTTSFGGTIANFGTFDTIVLSTNLLPGTETSFSTLVSGGIETLTVTSSVSGTIHTDKLTFASAPPGVFTVTNSAAGIVIADVPCFAAGTRILTSDGYRAVESLGVGDSVLTMRDGSSQKIIWVGQRTVDLSRHANPEKAQPVRICAGAFAPGLPERDLRLSPDHALFIDGHLIEAKTLVNGVTVIQEKTTRSVTYHHIELAQHNVVLAEGLEAETYLDSANRDNFAADAGPISLHPDFAAQSRALACAPLLTDGELVRATRQKLLDRAHALGFATTSSIDVAVKLDDRLIKPEVMEGELLFMLPAGAASVDLISATGVPAEISASPDDRRALGLAVTAITLVANGTRHVIALDDDRHEGFYAMESGHRWTNGTTRIALPAYHGQAILEVAINGQAVRWAQAA
jgi:hypothetical protein